MIDSDSRGTAHKLARDLLQYCNQLVGQEKRQWLVKQSHTCTWTFSTTELQGEERLKLVIKRYWLTYLWGLISREMRSLSLLKCICENSVAPSRGSIGGGLVSAVWGTSEQHVIIELMIRVDPPHLSVYGCDFSGKMYQRIWLDFKEYLSTTNEKGEKCNSSHKIIS